MRHEACEAQLLEIVALVKPSQQPSIEFCVVRGCWTKGAAEQLLRSANRKQIGRNESEREHGSEIGV